MGDIWWFQKYLWGAKHLSIIAWLFRLIFFKNSWTYDLIHKILMIVFLIVKFYILLFRTVNNTLIRAIKPNRDGWRQFRDLLLLQWLKISEKLKFIADNFKYLPLLNRKSWIKIWRYLLHISQTANSRFFISFIKKQRVYTFK